jgi:tRNA pseudouridine13 synthase
MFEIPDWPYALGSPDASGLLRCSPRDFEVEEIARVTPAGEGAHLWLWVEKRGANTDWVARQLAAACGCRSRDVGYAGLKDRRAVTRQWFSLPLAESTPVQLEHLDIEGVTVLETRRHTRKLKRGTLDGNRFSLVLRDFSGDEAETERRLETIGARGVPNYFGPQRFGHGGANVARGFEALKNGIRLQRNKKSIYLSALRSFLFNQVLAARVHRGDWDAIIKGELAMLDGTHSIFPCEEHDPEIEERCRCHDIHPTGPMPGKGGTAPGDAALALEQSVLDEWVELVELLAVQGVKADRRALRLIPADLEWALGEGALQLSFTLPPGAYATTVLREILVSREPDKTRP